MYARAAALLSLTFTGVLLLANLTSLDANDLPPDLKYFQTCTNYADIYPGSSAGGVWVPDNCVYEHVPPREYRACLAKMSLVVIGDHYGRGLVKVLPKGMSAQPILAPTASHGIGVGTRFMREAADVALLSLGVWDMSVEACGVESFYDGVKDLIWTVKGLMKKNAEVVLRNLPSAALEKTEVTWVKQCFPSKKVALFQEILEVAAQCTGTALFDVAQLGDEFGGRISASPLKGAAVPEEASLFLNSACGGKVPFVGGGRNCTPEFESKMKAKWMSIEAAGFGDCPVSPVASRKCFKKEQNYFFIGSSNFFTAEPGFRGHGRSLTVDLTRPTNNEVVHLSKVPATKRLVVGIVQDDVTPTAFKSFSKVLRGIKKGGTAVIYLPPPVSEKVTAFARNLSAASGVGISQLSGFASRPSVLGKILVVGEERGEGMAIRFQRDGLPAIYMAADAVNNTEHSNLISTAGLAIVVPPTNLEDPSVLYLSMKALLAKLKEVSPHLAILSLSQEEYNVLVESSSASTARTLRDMLSTLASCMSVPLVSHKKLPGVIHGSASLDVISGGCLDEAGKLASWGNSTR